MCAGSKRRVTAFATEDPTVGERGLGTEVAG